MLKVLQKLDNDKWAYFYNFSKIITAYKEDEVLNALTQAAQLSETGKYVPGFICYEASRGLDKALITKGEANLTVPLVWFAVFDDFRVSTLATNNNRYSLNWHPDTEKQEYEEAIEQIKRHIATGNTYQVNYTIRLSSDFNYDCFEYFCTIANSCDAKYCWFIETDDFAVCSFSPELFFELENNKITTKPVKGTISRAMTCSGDLKQRNILLNSEKDLAENVMIVDMLRNDLGKISDAGSVRTARLFETEKYPTLYQLSSTITAKTSKRADQIIENIFPCASITGAPKCKTMEIIASMEKSTRGLYTGSIGCFYPNNKADFNVAIRTLTIDKHNRKAVYGTGGGIVWDSEAKSEYNECMTKALVLENRSNDFKLIETIRWSSKDRFYLEGLHIKRLSQSAEYFDFKFDEAKIRTALRTTVNSLKHNEYKIRLLLSKDGAIETQKEPLTHKCEPLKVCICPWNIDSKNVFMYHKTTNRKIYEKAFELKGNADEVLLYNEAREITECTYHNIAFESDEILYTPPIECGLLNGTLREKMLNEGKLIEKIIPLESICNYRKIYLLNSVRGLREAEISN